MGKSTGFSLAEMEDMPEAMFSTFLEFALRVHGHKPEDVVMGDGPPPGQPWTELPREILDRLPAEARAALGKG